MNYVQAPKSLPRAFAFGGNTPAARIERKLFEEVLPHFYAPASRQPALDSIAPPPMTIDADVVLDSPSFTPAALQEFQAGGFARRNRWSK